jgi:type II secretory pathway pseudopilin PulG
LEVCTVIAIMTLLMTLVLYATSAMRRNTKLKSAAASASVLKAAIEKYKEIYGVFPDRAPSGGGAAWRNFEIIRALRNWRINTPLGDKSGRDARFSRDAMLDKLDAAQLDAQDNCIDPWGQPYAIAMLPDEVWRIYQKMAQASRQGATLPLPSDESQKIADYGASEARALYWVNHIKAQVCVYSCGPDRVSDWGHTFGDGSGYTKGPWGYYNKGENDTTPQEQRGDDIRAGGL